MANDSIYRELCNQLDSHTVNWPVVLRRLVASEYRRQQPRLTPYTSTVAIRRENSSWEQLNKTEDKNVRRLYKTCQDESGAVLTISRGNDRDEYLLLGWEWPNQSNLGGRAADLVGLNSTGGLVVIEAKWSDNKDTPLMAMLQGLDYLVHLTLGDNFNQIIDDCDKRREQKGSRWGLPDAFQGLTPTINGTHEVIVLATPEYFQSHSATADETGARNDEWREFAGEANHDDVRLRFGFAETDFSCTEARWVSRA